MFINIGQDEENLPNMLYNLFYDTIDIMEYKVKK